MTARNYSSAAVATTLAGSVTNTATSFSITASSGYPSTPFTAIIDRDQATEEVVLVGALVGTSASSVTRGYDGTAAVAHSAGATFEHGVSAIDFREANTHVNATSGVHGTSGAIVDTSSVQTLTNKTLTSPTLTTPTITSPAVTGGTISGASITTGTVNPTTLQQGGVAVVTTTGSQTLTNKTLTAPAVSAPVVTGGASFTGTVSGDSASGFGAWQTYTPTLSSSTGATPTVGSGGTILGAYVQIGKTVHVTVEITFGTSPTSPGGIYFCSVPVASQNTTDVNYMGVAYFASTRAGVNLQVGMCIMGRNKTEVDFRFPSTATLGDYDALANTSPVFPFLSGEKLRWSLTYEAA